MDLYNASQGARQLQIRQIINANARQKLNKTAKCPY